MNRLYFISENLNGKQKKTTFAPSQRGALNNELRLYPKNLGR